MARRGGRINKGREVVSYQPAKEIREFITEPVEEEPIVILDELVVREFITEPAPADPINEYIEKPKKKKKRKKDNE